MDMKQEIMDDAVDDALGDADEEEETFVAVVSPITSILFSVDISLRLNI